jgi:hypothetical protein
MAGNYTLTIVKPDAFGANKSGKIIALLEEKGFRVKAARVLHLTKKQAGAFYEVHKDRPFYGELVEFMTSGPCMPLVPRPLPGPCGSSTPSRRAGTPSMPRTATRTRRARRGSSSPRRT